MGCIAPTPTPPRPPPTPPPQNSLVKFTMNAVIIGPPNSGKKFFI